MLLKYINWVDKSQGTTAMKTSWQRCALLILINLLLAGFLTAVFFQSQGEPFPQDLVAAGCTVIYGADEDNALGGNNEDFPNPETRIWFIPAGDGKFGRALVGYEGFIWQGGMNDQGLFFDAMAIEDSYPVEQGNKERYEGSLPSRALEICADVDCVRDLFNRYHAYDTWAFQFLFGDAEGNSVLIEPYTQTQGGGFQVGTNFLQSITNEMECRYCERYWIARSRFENADQLSIELIRDILDETQLDGDYPTQYSTVYDLKEKVIYLYLFHNFDEVRVFDLEEELAKGYHRFELDKLFQDTLGYYLFARDERFRQAEIRDDLVLVELDPEVYQRYLGRYQSPEEMDAAFPYYSLAYEDGDFLLKLMPDKAWLKLEALSETEFFHLSYFYHFEIKFQPDEDGNLSQFAYWDFEDEYIFTRISESTGEEEGQQPPPETFWTTTLDKLSSLLGTNVFKFLAIFLGLILLQTILGYLRSLLV